MHADTKRQARAVLRFLKTELARAKRYVETAKSDVLQLEKAVKSQRNLLDDLKV